MAFLQHLLILFILHLSPRVLSVARAAATLKCDPSDTRISAALGQEAFLPCETQHSMRIAVHESMATAGNGHDDGDDESNDYVNLIHWYRHPSSKPFYTVDARGKPIFGQTEAEPDASSIESYTSLTESISGTKLFAPRAVVRHRKVDERMRFDFRQATPFLRVQNITELDEGVYQCRVEYAGRGTLITKVCLSVIGSPVGLVITDHRGNRLKDFIGPFDEFESVTLFCTAFGGRPRPSVVWFKQNGYFEELVDDSCEQGQLKTAYNGTINVVRNKLHLRRLDRFDYHVRYICRASTAFSYPPLVESVVIDMNLMPINVRIYSESYHASPKLANIVAGRVVEFGCRSDGSRPEAKIEWFLANQRIVAGSERVSADNETVGDLVATTTSTTFESPTSMALTNANLSTRFLSIYTTSKPNGTTVSVIRLIPHQSDNQRLLSCHASNPFVRHRKMITDQLMLDVKFAPEIFIEVRSSQQLQTIDREGESLRMVRIVEGESDIELNCHIKANPWVDEIIWYLDDAVPITTSLFTAFDLSLYYLQNRTSMPAGGVLSLPPLPRSQSEQSDDDADDDQPSIQLDNHNQTLRIVNAQHRFHNRTYRCAARNEIERTMSEAIIISVAYKPECRHNRTELLDAQRNVVHRLKCPIDELSLAGEPEVHYRWTLYQPWRTQMSYVEMAELTTPGDQSTLRIDRTIEHYLELHPMKTTTSNNNNNQTTSTSSSASSPIASTLLIQCEAVNSAGRQEVPCGFLLRLLDGPPEPPRRCNFSVHEPGVTELNETLLQQLQKEEKAVDIDHDNINHEETAAVGIVVVDCLTGNAGTIHRGSNSQLHHHQQQPQRLHLLGIDSTLLPSSSLELTLEQIETTIDAWRWNRSTAVMVDTTSEVVSYARFVLPRVVANRSYHFVAYARNEIGPSSLRWFGPMVFKWDDHVFGTQSSSLRVSDWTYRRLRGLLLVLGLIGLMALATYYGRRHLYTSTLYDTFQHFATLDRHGAAPRLPARRRRSLLVSETKAGPSNNEVAPEQVKQLDTNELHTNEDIDDEDDHHHHHGGSDESDRRPKEEAGTLKPKDNVEGVEMVEMQLDEIELILEEVAEQRRTERRPPRRRQTQQHIDPIEEAEEEVEEEEEDGTNQISAHYYHEEDEDDHYMVIHPLATPSPPRSTSTTFLARLNERAYFQRIRHLWKGHSKSYSIDMSDLEEERRAEADDLTTTTTATVRMKAIDETYWWQCTSAGPIDAQPEAEEEEEEPARSILTRLFSFIAQTTLSFGNANLEPSRQVLHLHPTARARFWPCLRSSSNREDIRVVLEPPAEDNGDNVRLLYYFQH